MSFFFFFLHSTFTTVYFFPHYFFWHFFFFFYRVSLVERCIRSLKVMKPSSHFFNIQPLPIPSFPSTVRTLLVSQFILISGIVFPLLDAIQVIGLHKPFETGRDCLQRKVKLLVFLVACTQLYRSLCQLRVGQSVHPSIDHLFHIVISFP